MKEPISRERFMPTARTMPIWGFRSSPSMTKMFTSSRAPAMMLKLPIMRKRAPRESPAALASRRTVCFGVSIADRPASGPSASRMSAVTVPVSASPPSTPPRLETKVTVRGSAPAARAAAVRVPGGRNASRVSLPPSPTPARPSCGTTRSTRNVCGVPNR
ncbi:hypothetical protein ABZ498_10135 [Streptomyces lavendulocolor]|uniref:hypothetical protein n=1 Tax=Streptomyces lavendulocolor TaxID=67316 RepID=UPI0033EBA6F7